MTKGETEKKRIARCTKVLKEKLEKRDAAYLLGVEAEKAEGEAYKAYIECSKRKQAAVYRYKQAREEVQEAQRALNQPTEEQVQ
jgi:hypothetical protein